jgi:hypothetical protein
LLPRIFSDVIHGEKEKENIPDLQFHHKKYLYILIYNHYQVITQRCQRVEKIQADRRRTSLKKSGVKKLSGVNIGKCSSET